MFRFVNHLVLTDLRCTCSLVSVVLTPCWSFRDVEEQLVVSSGNVTPSHPLNAFRAGADLWAARLDSTDRASIMYCPGSGQDRVNFCSSEERVWLGPEGYSIPLHILPANRGLVLFE